METVEFCPICNNNSFIDAVKLKDYFFTKEDFTIQKCSACGFMLTNPRPGKNEIGKYYESENYLSHNEAKQTLFSKAYNWIRIINIKKKANIIQSNSTGNSILDIGCGVGLLLKEMKRRGWEITGVEPGPEAKLSAESNLGQGVHQDISNLLNQKHEVICMWHVLEHVSEIRDYFSKLKVMLKNEGTLIIAVPNASSPESSMYGKYWAAYDVPRHLSHFRPQDIEELCKKEGLRVIKTIPMWFDAFYICLLSEKYKLGLSPSNGGGVLLLIKAMSNALRSNLAALMNKRNCTSLIYIIKKT